MIQIYRTVLGSGEKRPTLYGMGTHYGVKSEGWTEIKVDGLVKIEDFLSKNLVPPARLIGTERVENSGSVIEYWVRIIP